MAKNKLLKLSSLRLLTLDLTGTVFRFSRPPFVTYTELANSSGFHDVQESRVKEGFKKAWVQLNKAEPNFGSEKGDSKSWWINLVTKTFKGKAFENSLINT